MATNEKPSGPLTTEPHGVGESRNGDVHSIHRKAQRASRHILWYKKHKSRSEAPEISENHRRYLEEEGAFLKLPRSTTDALLPLYVTFLDDLIPLVDGARLFREYSNGKGSGYLIRAVCLVACKMKQAPAHLRLTEDGPVHGPLEFSTKLLHGLEVAIKANLEPDRITTTQILGLIHLHNDGVGGTGRSSSYLSQAISIAWALSLHFRLPGIPAQEQCEYLWWSLRNLDRLNKPVMDAGPFLIDDADVALERPPVKDSDYRSQLMGISLALGDLMVKATKVYKASSMAREDDLTTFPTFGDVAGEDGVGSFFRSHQAYLEIWYHVASMLSCRYSGPGSQPYSRRLKSAARIIEIASSEGCDHLPPLPLVPYAISMSTTMIYRAFRDGERTKQQTRESLRLCCEALEELSPLWTTAKGVAKLAKKLWTVLCETGRQSAPNNHIALTAADQSQRASLRESVTASESSGNVPVVATGSYARVNTFDPTQSFVSELPQPWETETPYLQLDTAFHDLFDYGIPNVFRDPTTWENLYVASDGSPESAYVAGQSDVMAPFANHRSGGNAS